MLKKFLIGLIIAILSFLITYITFKTFGWYNLGKTINPAIFARAISIFMILCILLIIFILVINKSVKIKRTIKNVILILDVIIIILTFLWLIYFGINYCRCLHFKEPIFVIDKSYCLVWHSDGTDHAYYKCLGYEGEFTTKNGKIIRITMNLFGKEILDKKVEIDLIPKDEPPSNKQFENYIGIQRGSTVKSLLKLISSHNATNATTISVRYLEGKADMQLELK